jgi:hypothetical protein
MAASHSPVPESEGPEAPSFVVRDRGHPLYDCPDNTHEQGQSPRSFPEIRGRSPHLFV